jgi:hypothetical protein
MKAIAAAVVVLALCAVLRADPHPRLAEFKELRDYSSWQEVRGALLTCQGCHGEQNYTDGLYRSYLSDGNVAAKP